MKKPLEGPMVHSVSGYLAALRSHRIAGSAGDHGSTMVYVDDDGAFRCFFQRYQSIANQQTFNTKADVRRWLKEWLPQERIAA